MQHMQAIGRIKQVQVQRSNLKLGQKPSRRYDPTPIQVVNRLQLSFQGAVGVITEQEQIIDVHNSEHPQTRYTGSNGLSICFTSHYQAMRERFGAHLVDGCAGENILIAVDSEIALPDLEPGIVIHNEQSGQYIYLKDVIIAAPCLEFSCFALKERAPSEALLKEALQFLHHGRRGFYATLVDMQNHPSVQAGDQLFSLV